jgi:hypothetical protein
MKTEIASAAVSLFVSSQGSWVEHEQKLLVELPRKLKRAYIKSREAVSSESDDDAQEIIERCRIPEFGTRKRKAEGEPLGMTQGYGSPQAHTVRKHHNFDDSEDGGLGGRLVYDGNGGLTGSPFLPGWRTGGNDPKSYQLGPEPPEWNLGIKPADFDDKFGDFFAGESDDEDKDPAEPDSDSDSQEELESDQPTLFCTDKQPKSGDIKSRVLAMNGKTQAQALDSSFKKNGATKKYTQGDLSYDLSRGFLRWSTDASEGESDEEDAEHEADWVQVQKPGRKKRQVGTVLYGLLAQTLSTNTEAAMFADAVLGAGDSDGTCVSQGKKMPVTECT